jgi:hypothetical protein
MICCSLFTEYIELELEVSPCLPKNLLGLDNQSRYRESSRSCTNLGLVKVLSWTIAALGSRVTEEIYGTGHLS